MEKKTPKKPASKPKAKMGRPTKYSVELANAICKLIASGISLHKICQHEDMPSREAVYEWLANPEHKYFTDNFLRAREIQATTLLDEIPDIADDSSQDEIFSDEGKRMLNVEFVQRSKLRIEARLKYAAKICPKKYGEKITQEVSGIDGEPIKTESTVRIYVPDNNRDIKP